MLDKTWFELGEMDIRATCDTWAEKRESSEVEP